MASNCTDAEERCTLASQTAADPGPVSLPDGERARYLDYEHHAFPSHWGEEDQGMKTPTTPKPPVVITGHCTGLVHTQSGVVSTHATNTTSQAGSVAKPTTPPAYPC